MVPNAQPIRPSLNKATTSTEKVEKVVKPPQKPVVSMIFQIGSILGALLNQAKGDNKGTNTVSDQGPRCKMGKKRIKAVAN